MYTGALLIATAGIKAAVIMHMSLLSNVLKLPQNFYETTPTGRILARFSSDLNTLDFTLIFNLRQCLANSLRVRELMQRPIEDFLYRNLFRIF